MYCSPFFLYTQCFGSIWQEDLCMNLFRKESWPEPVVGRTASTIEGLGLQKAMKNLFALKVTLDRDFGAAVYRFEAPSGPKFCLGMV